MRWPGGVWQAGGSGNAGTAPRRPPCHRRLLCRGWSGARAPRCCCCCCHGNSSMRVLRRNVLCAAPAEGWSRFVWQVAMHTIRMFLHTPAASVRLKIPARRHHSHAPCEQRGYISSAVSAPLLAPQLGDLRAVEAHAGGAAMIQEMPVHVAELTLH